MQTIEIPISKRKLIISLIGCLAFVGQAYYSFILHRALHAGLPSTPKS